MFSLLRSNHNRHFVGIVGSDCSYVIGFRQNQMAKYVHSVLPAEPDIAFIPAVYERTHLPVLNSTHELKAFGIPNEAISFLNMDTHAKLIFPKNPSTYPHHYKLHDMEEKEYISLIYDKYVGIIMPYQLVEEDAKSITFLSHMISPLDDTHRFKRVLLDES
jgi:hypothetical protein